MRWLEEQRSLNRRLEDHLAYTTVPRVATELGTGWRAEGLRLTGPRGEDLEFDLSGFFGPPELIIYLDRRLEKPADVPTSISVAPTARPETIVRELCAELLPFRVAELSSKPAAASPRPQTPALR